MNRNSKESLARARSKMAGMQHRRFRSASEITRDTDENLDLFSRNRRSLSVIPTDESDGSLKLWKVSVILEKPASDGTDDLLASVDGGKHDYDWLLTPPGSPLVSTFSTLIASEPQSPQPTLLAPRSGSSLKSVSTTKALRLSATHSVSSYASRPISSSVPHSPISSDVHHNMYSFTSNRSSSIVNTSSSVSSSIPSTPTRRSGPTARRLTSSARPVPSQSSTPAKSLPASTISYGEKAPVTQKPRPLTTSARPQSPRKLCSVSARSNSRSSTPTCRTSVQTPASDSAAVHSVSVRWVPPNSRNPAISRGSSPGPHTGTSPRPIIPPDFSHEMPRNLRTKMPDQPVSAGRTRPGIAVTLKGNSEASGLASIPRRHSLPILMGGRLPELSGRISLHANGHHAGAPESLETPPVLRPSMLKPANSMKDTEDTGFARTISKKSLDVALRNMDIRHGGGSIRSSVAGTTLFRHNIRSSGPKSQHGHASKALVSRKSEQPVSYTSITGNGCQSLENWAEENDDRLPAKLSEPDIFESSYYDTILLKEVDSKNSNWLLNPDDTSDQGFIFDHRFEPLPELSGLI